MRERLATKGIGLEVTPAVLEYLAKEGYNPQYGARPLKRLIQNKILTPVASQIIARTVSDGTTVAVDVQNGEFVFDVKKPKPLKPVKSDVMKEVREEAEAVKN